MKEIVYIISRERAQRPNAIEFYCESTTIGEDKAEAIMPFYSGYIGDAVRFKSEFDAIEAREKIVEPGFFTITPYTINEQP